MQLWDVSYANDLCPQLVEILRVAKEMQRYLAYRAIPNQKPCADLYQRIEALSNDLGDATDAYVKWWAGALLRHSSGESPFRHVNRGTDVFRTPYIASYQEDPQETVDLVEDAMVEVTADGKLREIPPRGKDGGG